MANLPAPAPYRWVDQIGHQLVRDIRVEYGGDRLYGEWLDVWNEVNQAKPRNPGIYPVYYNHNLPPDRLLLEGPKSDMLTEPDPDKFAECINKLIQDSDNRMNEIQCVKVHKHYIHKENSGKGIIGVELKPGFVCLIGHDTKTTVVAHLKRLHYNINALQPFFKQHYNLQAFELLLPNTESNNCVNGKIVKKHVQSCEYSFNKTNILINCETGEIFQYECVKFTPVCESFNDSDIDSDGEADIEPGIVANGNHVNKPYLRRSNLDFDSLYPSYNSRYYGDFRPVSTPEGDRVGMMKSYEPKKKVTEKDLGVKKPVYKKDKWFYGKR